MQVTEQPIARDDVFTFAFDADQAAPASLFADNGSGTDAPGNPAATIASFGGGQTPGGGDSADREVENLKAACEQRLFYLTGLPRKDQSG